MNRTERHFTRFMRIALMLLMLTPTPAVWAQSPASQPAAAQDVTIIIQKQQVRFTAQRAVEQMQLQVFNQSGELVFDSNPVAASEINWPFQNAGGEAIKSGLYVYTLSIKEAGAETARVRRGHFIVDRAQDRDGADKLWVTSQNDNGVGTELTLARDENTTVAGVSAPRREGKERGEAKRDGEDEAKKDGKAAKAELAVAGVGVPNQIAKFVSEEEIGSSAITESTDGNVGIGTTSPSGRLHIVGGADFAENFDVSEPPARGKAVAAKVEAGMVVSIDPANPGKLQLSTQAYDYQVAGIISGAGGVQPGMMIGQPGTLADGKHPVALSGRVYCWADASNGPIKPGDLLTTSDTPGHAMKVTDRVKAQGVLHAPRQVGKTTALMELARQLTAEGRYTALLVTMEAGAAFNDDPGAAELAILGTWRGDAEAHLPPELRPPAWPTAAPGERIYSALQAWAQVSPRPLVLFLDEIDVLEDEALISVLRQLRAGHPEQLRHCPHSLTMRLKTASTPHSSRTADTTTQSNSP